MHNLNVARQLLAQSLNQRCSTARRRWRLPKRAERSYDERADRMENDCAVFYREVCDSSHALRNLRWTLCPNKCEDELDAPLRDRRHATSENRLDSFRVNELLKYSLDSAPFKKRANHGARAMLANYLIYEQQFVYHRTAVYAHQKFTSTLSALSCLRGEPAFTQARDLLGIMFLSSE